MKSFRLVGLGFWQAWWMLGLCTSTILPFSYTAAFLFDPTLLVTLISALCFLVVVGLSKKFSSFLKRPVFFWIAGACSSLGTLAMALLAHGIIGDALAIPYAVATVVFSFGSALLLVMWGELWSTLATGRVGRFLYVSYAFAFFLFFAINALPISVEIALTSILPIVSVGVLYISQDEPRREPASVIFDMEPVSRPKIYLWILILSVVYGLCQSVSLTLGEGPDTASQSFLLAGAGILALALSIFIAPPDVESFSLYRPIIPAFACGLILMVLLPKGLLFVGGGLAIIAIYSLDMLMMLVSTDVAFRTRTSVALIFGTVLFTARIGTFLGIVIFRLAQGSPLWDGNLPWELMLASAVLIVLAGTVLFTQIDLQKLYSPRSITKTSSESVLKKCKDVADICGLTSREQEVFYLLACGRTVPYICKELVIASGTAKHHVSSIYRKVGVYDRQGLLDVIEQGSVGRSSL
jgi:DNA-binding CsgD family transcriptional regulator